MGKDVDPMKRCNPGSLRGSWLCAVFCDSSWQGGSSFAVVQVNKAHELLLSYIRLQVHIRAHHAVTAPPNAEVSLNCSQSINLTYLAPESGHTTVHHTGLKPSVEGVERLGTRVQGQSVGFRVCCMSPLDITTQGSLPSSKIPGRVASCKHISIFLEGSVIGFMSGSHFGSIFKNSHQCVLDNMQTD